MGMGSCFSIFLRISTQALQVTTCWNWKGVGALLYTNKFTLSEARFEIDNWAKVGAARCRESKLISKRIQYIVRKTRVTGKDLGNGCKWPSSNYNYTRSVWCLPSSLYVKRRDFFSKNRNPCLWGQSNIIWQGGSRRKTPRPRGFQGPSNTPQWWVL